MDDMICSRCGRKFDPTTTQDDSSMLCQSCMAHERLSNRPVIRGWQCVKCGAILSPFQMYCSFCAPSPKITCDHDV